ncbi:4-hydroxy-3-methylbut-2-enyl diphosphate reductase [Acuticoccus sp. M5D2P5]|uniref:4-hydroxy-3-methylbut-2-enyl diphosphate reductase n=1 Tax=Acuticoccus kalidii TaxID=2910977 RepID=UPI001F257048|nr:4-hydroxy-3-methylbut-2-enyl diphosphate reductase [Acuticoccus kalidii]MCF3935825.1 4-hydroxy-3-methylbut-2-enyl diphosphate reductase [Acuticoccus kalidii]
MAIQSDASTTLNVILAQPRGFCAGVVRAIDAVEDALQRHDAPVYVRHEIVHNRHVVNELEKKGAVFVDELSEVPDGAVTIFSAHGVSRVVEREAERRKLPVIDSTCPLVAKVHKQGRRYRADGREVILIGHAGHPEVTGTLGQIDGEVTVVATVDDVEKLPFDNAAPLAYITQTTLSVDDTSTVIAALKQRFTNIVGPDTRDICYATQNRQAAVRGLADVAEVIIVIGASNSSNSTRLAEVAREAGAISYLVPDETALESAWFDGVTTVGVTAGASAPEVLVQRVVERLATFRPIETSTLAGPQESVRFAPPSELSLA